MEAQPCDYITGFLDRGTLLDGPAEIIRLPGVSGFGDAHVALAGAIRSLEPGRVLVAGPGAVPTALWVARAGTALSHLTDSAAEARSLDATLHHNGLAGIQSTCDWSPVQGDCDLALVHLPRGRELQKEYLRFATYSLKPGGRLIFVGAKDEGIKTAVTDARSIVGRAGVVVRKGGYHAAMAYRPAGDVARPQLTFEAFDVTVDSIPTRLVSCTGAFAGDRVDGGAAALIEAMAFAPGSTVLDMGCGTGLVALAAARRGARVVATDVSYRAVASTQRTLEANHQQAVSVRHTCGAGGAEAGEMDVVATNPPFHRGHDISFEVPRFFVREAARVLRPGGHLYLVANEFLDYAPWLSKHFTIHPPAFEDRRYRVWHAVRDRSPVPQPDTGL